MYPYIIIKASRITNQVNKNVHSYTYMVKLALLISVSFCRTRLLDARRLFHTNKLQYTVNSRTPALCVNVCVSAMSM